MQLMENNRVPIKRNNSLKSLHDILIFVLFDDHPLTIGDVHVEEIVHKGPIIVWRGIVV